MRHPFDNLIDNLRGVVPVSTAFRPRERAYEDLKLISGEDWGYDADAWLARRSDILKMMTNPRGTCEPDLRFALAVEKHKHGPCPYCGQPLRSDNARQCFLCGMDWHDPVHAIKRGQPTELTARRDRSSVRPYHFPIEWLSRRASSPQVLLRRYGELGSISELIKQMRQGDQIRKFNSPQENWQQRVGRFGYAIVRDGKPVSMIVLWLN